jgi:hypothetical protein
LDIVPQQYFKKLVGTEDLWEIRAQTGGHSYRFLGFFDGPSLLILTSGFSTKTTKDVEPIICKGEVSHE